MSTALYRRYRPETFADVIGQEHVTDPLMAAIDKDRINHAYLFSGPRGCGKTTSARILARCLNCAQGPTSTPCGVCDSCVELARNGSGSLDVIEIDAASHGGVDDARDLRERATFAPVRDRFKIFIIDEAHMVTSAGFNALLKIVEEPPEHILFIFATTEPDKVIGTIRSRTHHYPFRLVPPEPLLAYLEQLCRQEDVPVASGVLSLVIRAGGGSVRDSLSVLDQLMAGAGENGLDYELAVSLLGYTHATLLDDVVESIAAGDSGTVFDAVDRVIQTGHDPRRFVEDLLERFRDLIVINAVPEGAASILRGVPDDQLNRMRTQSTQLGAGELSRAADVTNTALTEMTGATSPRLHLELLCARLLLPAADATTRGTLARVDRIERRLEYADGTAPAAPAAPAEETSKPPARPRLDGVPRTAEEAAARWSLPSADPTASDASQASTPATSRPSPAAQDASADWGGNWGASTDTAFSEPTPRGPVPAPAASNGPAIPAAQQPAGPAIPAAQQPGSPAASSGWDDAASSPATDLPLPQEDEDTAPQASSTHAPAPQDSWVDDRPSVPHDTSRTEPMSQAPPSEQAPDRQAPAPGGVSGGNVEMVRRAWPEIMDEVAKIKRATWLIVNVSATPRSFDGNQLVLAFANQGNAIGFQRGAHMDNLRQAIHTVLGLSCSIDAVHDAGGSGESGPKVPASRPAGSSTPGPVAPAVPAVDRIPAREIPGITARGGTDQARSAGYEASRPVEGAIDPGSERPAGAPTPSVDPASPTGLTRSGDGPAAEGGADPTRPVPAPTSRSTPRPPAPERPSPALARRDPDAAPDAVGAWDPAMSDDSWSLVEPPEEAFDPGPDRHSVPEGTSGRAAAGPASATGPATGPRRDAGSPAPAASSPPAPSRSVIWSPDPVAPDATQGRASHGSHAADHPVRSTADDRATRSVAVRQDSPAAPATGLPSFLRDGHRGPDEGAGNGVQDASGRHTEAPGNPDTARGVGGQQEATPEHTAEARFTPGRTTSRYQQLLDEAERKRTEEERTTRGAVDLSFVEDEPSADDETLEDSGLVGRRAIERILNGRLIEERGVDGR